MSSIHGITKHTMSRAVKRAGRTGQSEDDIASRDRR